MAKRKSYKQDFRASVQGNKSPKREQVEKLIGKYITEPKINKQQQVKQEAWFNRLKIKQASAKRRNEEYQDMAKMIYPQHFRNKILAQTTPNEIVNKLVASLYELYKEQLPNIRYVALHQDQLNKMFGDLPFAKAWESEVFRSLVLEYTTKQLSDEELLKYVTNLDKYNQAKLYNLLFSYKAMPTGHYKGIQETLARIAANRQAILAGTMYENVDKEEQDKYVSAYYKAFREWAKSIDKTQYDSEDAFAAFQSVNFTDIESLNMSDKLAGELADRLSMRAQDKLEEEEILDNLFKKTSRFRLHSMGRSGSSKNDLENIEDVLYDESISLEDRMQYGRDLGLIPIMKDIYDDEGNKIGEEFDYWARPLTRGMQL